MDPKLNPISFMVQKQAPDLYRLSIGTKLSDPVFPEEKDAGDLDIKRPVSVCNHTDFHQVVGRLHFERETETKKKKK